MEDKKVVQNDEIDLIELAKVIWSKRWFISKVTGFFVLLGVIVAFTSKVEYEASCKLLSENQGGVPSLGGLGGLAGLAGIDLSTSGPSGILSPELYPEIVKSTPFIDKMLNTPIYFEKIDTTMSSFKYFKELDSPSLFDLIKAYTFGLPGKIKQIFSGSLESNKRKYDLLRFSKEEWIIVEKLKERILVSLESKTGTIIISVKMPDPVAAAKLTDLLVRDLTQEVTNYKIQKYKINLEFVRERFEEAKKAYESKQAQLARFADRNRNITNSIVQTEYDRLQNELNITFEVYKGLATQLEQAKIKVKEETPVFSILEPVRIPESRSEPNRILIIFVFIFIGVSLASFYIIFLKKNK